MKVCIVTTGQPSTNPRMVKEADALTAAGHSVEVIGAHWASWASELDAQMLPARSWRFTYVGGDQRQPDSQYYWSRLRQKAGRALWSRTKRLQFAKWACARPASELQRAAKRVRADLYIAHNLGALAPAVAAARHHGVSVGLDAEDFYSGMESWPGQRTFSDQLAEVLEREYLPQCQFLLAGSPAIADAYAAQYNVQRPVPIYNVFPLSYRPAHPPAPRPDGTPVRLYWFSQTIGPQRGLEDAVRAMGKVAQHPIELHLRGDWQPGYQESLLRLAVECGVNPERIHGHGTAPPERMAILASDYDVGLALEARVSQNRDLCVTNKICTYLLAGSAVVATATTGQAILFRDIPDSGFSYSPGDIDALAAGLRRWCESPEALQRAREGSWQYGATRYNWDVEQRELLRVLERQVQ